MSSDSTMYSRVGGEDFFEAVTLRFYQAVATDSLLRPLYPETAEQFEAARLHLKWFLMQYWGGPTLYADHRGHPRLRMRHFPFAIGVAERDAWFGHMSEAVRQAGLRPLDEAQMLGYFARAATALINVDPDGG